MNAQTPHPAVFRPLQARFLTIPQAPPERQRSRLAYEVLRGTATAADVIVWAHSAFERRKRVPASLPATVLREGRLLHAA